MATDLDSIFAISEEQIAKFRSDGFIRLKHVLTPEEIAYYGAEITKQTLDLNTQDVPIEERGTYGKAFLQVQNLWESSPVTRELVFSKRLARIAATLLEVSGVRLYHDQSLYKEPGGGITPAHADQYYWPLETDRTITAWIPLQAVPLEGGPLGFYAGSQNVEFGRDLVISDESEREITSNMEARGFQFIVEPFDLGDVSFHYGWTFHRAGENVTALPRSVMTIIYMDKDMRLKQPSNANQFKDWEQWCAGASVGEVINTPKNPVLLEASV